MDARSLSDTALHGMVWTSVQTVLNKVAVVVATLVLASHLTPADYGDAFNATTIGAFAFILAPWVLNDLLVSRPRRLGDDAGPALLLGIATALVFAAALVIAAPEIQRRFYPSSDHLVALIAVAAVRPLADALMAVPWARLRIDLQYRSIAITDGTCQLAGTLASVVMAVAGAGPLAIVAPPIAVLLLQAVWYWMRVRRTVPLAVERAHLWSVGRSFVIAGAGQYLNNVVKIIELLVLGWFARPSQVGLFAFAFQLSTQANVIIANQIASVIHPILSHINESRDRQVAAFLRTLRLVGCVGIPLSLVQAAVADPLFGLLFDARWSGAIPVFAALSLMQGFMFLSTPIMTLLKSQGHFRAILVWQLLHILLGGAAMVTCVHLTGESVTWLPGALGLSSSEDTPMPLMVAMVGSAAWALGCPLALMFASRGLGLRYPSLAQVLWQPWPVSIGAAVVLLILPHAVPGGDLAGRVVTLAASVPLAAFAVVLSASSHPQSREDMLMLWTALRTRLRKFRNPRRHADVASRRLGD